MYNMPRKVCRTFAKNKKFNILPVKEDALGTTYNVLQPFENQEVLRNVNLFIYKSFKVDIFAT